MDSIVFALFLSAIGLFTAGGAVLNWGWLLESHRSRVWVRLLGRDGARLAYTLVGLWLVALAFYLAVR